MEGKQSSWNLKIHKLLYPYTPYIPIDCWSQYVSTIWIWCFESEPIISQLIGFYQTAYLVKKPEKNSVYDDTKLSLRRIEHKRFGKIEFWSIKFNFSTTLNQVSSCFPSCFSCFLVIACLWDR